MWRDLRYGLRTLARQPGFTLLAIVSLGLGIGINSAVFSIVNTLLFKPWPVRAPEELISIYSYAPGSSMQHEPLAYPDFKDFRSQSDLFSAMFAYELTPAVLDRDGGSELAVGEAVTGDYFSGLGINAIQGRGLLPEDDRLEAPAAMVLSYNAWHRRFGADPAIIGKSQRINGVAFTIVGVAPPHIAGLTRGIAAEFWVPVAQRKYLQPERATALERRSSRGIFAMARLKPGATIEQAQAQLSTIAARLASEYPDSNKDRIVKVIAANSVRMILPDIDRILYAASTVLMLVVGLIMVIACVNVASMLLSRTTDRQKEIAIRLSIGANRGHLVRQLLVEGWLLSLGGAVVGLFLAFSTNRLLNSVQIPLPIPIQVHLGLEIDYRVVAFALAASVLTTVIFALMPALQATRRDLVTVMKDGGQSTAGKHTGRIRGAIIMAQVALSLVLFVGAGLSLRSLQNAHSIDPGFDPTNVVVAFFDLGLRGYDEQHGREFYASLQQRVNAIPGVVSTGYASHTPLSFEIRTTTIADVDRQPLLDADWPEVDEGAVAPGYFASMRIPVLQGRDFGEHDIPGSTPVVIVNQSLASRFWPGDNPVGKHITLRRGTTAYEVVGVVKDGKYRTLGENGRPFLFPNLHQDYAGSQTLVVRTNGDMAGAISAIRREAQALAPGLPALNLRTLQETTSVSLLLARSAAAVFGLFGVLGLVLASVGIYGVIAYNVSQRTHEIGVRVALGARRGDILRLVLGSVIRLAGGGIALGVAVAVAGTRLISTILYGVSPTDPITFGSVSLLLLAVAAVACYVPARRATRVDPIVALRYE